MLWENIPFFRNKFAFLLFSVFRLFFCTMAIFIKTGSLLRNSSAPAAYSNTWSHNPPLFATLEILFISILTNCDAPNLQGLWLQVRERSSWKLWTLQKQTSFLMQITLAAKNNGKEIQKIQGIDNRWAKAQTIQCFWVSGDFGGKNLFSSECAMGCLQPFLSNLWPMPLCLLGLLQCLESTAAVEWACSPQQQY